MKEEALAEKPILPPHLRKPRLTTPEASEYLAAAHGLKVAATTLSKLRCVGGGPAFDKFMQSCYYRQAALDEWVAQKLAESRPAPSGEAP